MLSIKNLCVKIDGKSVVEDVNIELKSSDINIILGPNGAGKTTFLKAIVGIIKSQTCEITLDNDNLTNQPIEKISQKIAYMGQFNSGTNLSVIDILELSRRKYSGMLLSANDYNIINTVIKELSLANFLHRNIDTLSGGERQKVFLGAALIQKPKVLLLDEPISHLDPKNQIEILEIIKKITKENNLITFVVLHDLQNSLHYGDKIIMFKDKKIIEFKESSSITADMINRLYDVHCELFWRDGHPFTFFKHSHINDHHSLHSHKEQQ